MSVEFYFIFQKLQHWFFFKEGDECIIVIVLSLHITLLCKTCVSKSHGRPFVHILVLTILNIKKDSLNIKNSHQIYDFYGCKYYGLFTNKKLIILIIVLP
jgi:hypothetical protein